LQGQNPLNRFGTDKTFDMIFAYAKIHAKPVAQVAAHLGVMIILELSLFKEYVEYLEKMYSFKKKSQW
jgi:hypothetical protein